MLCIMMHFVCANDITAHRVGFLCPAPTHAYSRIGNIANLIMLDSYPFYITRADTNTTPVLVCGVIDKIIDNVLISTNLAGIRRIIWQVRLETFVRINTDLYASTTNIFKQITLYFIVACTPGLVKCC
jgi:predicted membrane-bound dolichyl-phosphate-mannose-protein mannosyltransferase